MHTVRGLALAFGVFAASFALHIVGGATDQWWLFNAAVALIFVSAAGYGVIAWVLSGARSNDRLALVIGSVVGLVLTTSALRAGNDRTFEWWQVPLALLLVAAVSALLYGAWRLLRRQRGLPGRTATDRPG